MNEWIQEGHTLETTEMPLDEAKAAGLASFYPQIVLSLRKRSSKSYGVLDMHSVLL